MGPGESGGSMHQPSRGNNQPHNAKREKKLVAKEEGREVSAEAALHAPHVDGRVRRGTQVEGIEAGGSG